MMNLYEIIFEKNIYRYWLLFVQYFYILKNEVKEIFFILILFLMIIDGYRKIG